MNASERRIAVSVSVGAVVVGLGAGHTASWSTNLAAGVTRGLFAGLLVWLVLSAAAVLVRARFASPARPARPARPVRTTVRTPISTTRPRGTTYP